MKPTNGNNAPNNSMESEEEFHIEESQSSEDENAVPYITKDKLKANPELEKKKFDMRLLEYTGYRLESMRYFPYRTREGEIPKKLLQVPRLDFIFDSQLRLFQQQENKPFDQDLI